MLEKFIIIYTFMTSLNQANKLSTWAALNGQDNKAEDSTAGNLQMTNDMETWQPVIQTRNWLAPPPPEPPNYSTLPSTSSIIATSTPSLQSSSLKKTNLAGKTDFQQQYFGQNHKTKNYFTHNHHRSGNYNKFHDMTALSSSAAATNSTNIKFQPYIFYKQHQIPSYRHHHQQPLHLSHIVKNSYPEIAVDITSQEQKPHMNKGISSSFTPNRLQPEQHHHHSAAATTTDVNQHREHQLQYPEINSAPNIGDEHYHHPPYQATSSSNILLKPLNFFETNKNLIDSNFRNSLVINSRKRMSGDDVANNVVHLNKKLLPLKRSFDNVAEFYVNTKDMKLIDKDNAHNTYSNEDKTNDDNDLTKLNSTPEGVVTPQPTTSTTSEVPAASFKYSNDTTLSRATSPSLSIGEVQGHERQLNKGSMIENPLISSRAEAASLFRGGTQNESVKAATLAEATARGEMLWNKSKSTSISAPRSSSSSSSLSSIVATGRKTKKFKKKFQKFLLPLVLAYKLKFLALIPLLVGGLTLLVGTTGLAGFFFALFTAVMSLKSGSRGAIVVKKY